MKQSAYNTGNTLCNKNYKKGHQCRERTNIFFLPQIEPALRRGDSVYLVGLSRSLQATSRKSVVTNPGAALNVGAADCPRYRAMNMEVIELDTGQSLRLDNFFGGFTS